ncbi:nucleotide exchange factor GrpE [Niallia endozanthoxylica]|uniref:Protein GrpE n=1 Tax=Niallia endozanthoxylica TaxID=2036016 RepID=A0A5J5HZE4_9BACI|nr:nucleotide exchange factor GrpE [Niallia endozanthoxylica]KAA9026362.1 nucleotide exchange factor GrpE [Niallia endozanthoxylica]
MSEKELNEEKSTVKTAENTAEAEEVEVVEEVFAEEPPKEEEKSEQLLQTEIEELKKQNAELQTKLDEAENRILRVQADFENARRRARLDLEASEKYKAQSLISDLLPAIDNFERALAMEADNEQAKSLLQGVEMVYRSLLDALKNAGAEQIEAVGKEFDPHIHQAIMQVEDENFGSNVVVEEFQKGYILKDRVIRPAMVKVNQ